MLKLLGISEIKAKDSTHVIFTDQQKVTKKLTRTICRPDEKS